MAEESKLRECSYFLVRYVPDALREEFLNIGVFLHSPAENFLDCLFTDDIRRIKRFHPQADTGLLRELQAYFEDQIKEHEGDLDGYLREMQESFSNLIQVTSPRACLVAEPQAEMQELFARYVGARLTGPPAQDTRMRIKQHLTDALRRHGVLEHPQFEKRVPAERWTHKGDPLCFDFGYRPLQIEGKPNGHAKLIHALSLRRDNEIAHVLANTIRYVRGREPADLTAVVEGLPVADDPTALHSERILLDAEIRLQPLSGVEAFAQSVRAELPV
jgi:hypothetical protein